MQGATIGSKHTYKDYGLMFTSPPVISPAKPRENWVEIPGMDGALDLSKVQTGKMQYGMRTITMPCVFTGPREEWPVVLSEILFGIHGKDAHITLDNDPDYYYAGIARVEKYDPKRAHFGLTIICTVQPYKYTLDGMRWGF